MGPEPCQNRIIAVSSVVMFASKIVLKTFSYPASTALENRFPAFCSSRIRSKINTLASTAIPIVSTIPAIPARVRVGRPMGPDQVPAPVKSPMNPAAIIIPSGRSSTSRLSAIIAMNPGIR